MPFFFILIGIGLLVVGYRGTQKDLFALLKGDFSGPNNFILFAAGIFVVGLMGYAPKLKGLSDALMVLLIIVILLANQNSGGGGFFTMLVQQLKATQNPQPTTNH